MTPSLTRNQQWERERERERGRERESKKKLTRLCRTIHPSNSIDGMSQQNTFSFAENKSRNQ